MGKGEVIFDVFFFKQKTAYEMRISDWSSDVCSSDLAEASSVNSIARFASNAKAMAFTLATSPRLKPSGTTRPDAERLRASAAQIGRASCRERVCQYV